jgi:uncharacterized protein YrrD
VSADSLLTSALDVPGRPVVTLAGEDIAQVRDVVFDRGGRVTAFTLAGRGLLSGPMKPWLPWSAVHGFGPDALVVADDAALQEGATPGVDGSVIGDEVLTRSGTVVGTVVDAILRLDGASLDVVGYEVEGANGEAGRFVPLPDTLSVNAGRLVVPDSALQFLSDDLAGFGASVDTFRSRLHEDQR